MMKTATNYPKLPIRAATLSAGGAAEENKTLMKAPQEHFSLSYGFFLTLSLNLFPSEVVIDWMLRPSTERQRTTEEQQRRRGLQVQRGRAVAPTSPPHSEWSFSVK